ncbi:MAG TPA: SDR family oxidoreductase [Acetobacteraceae bacterium]|jgi:NAD(P)-dependent dehydrogenase (short-subunit alcohol dehydrogenase family)|nr:SDR family oxidoreductase [Acetobacteraceae bacterium]
MALQADRRVALVTGASYGIGGATAIGLAQDGFDVAVTDLTTDTLSHTVAGIEQAGSRALRLALDLRHQASVEQAVADTVAAFGHLDVLVNNAGVPSPGKPAIELTRAEWEANIGVNLTGTWFMSTTFGRYLIQSGRPGCVVSLASTHGTVGFPNTSAYGVAKAGISQMTRLLAIEWAPHNIRVVAIAPGTTLTESRRPMLQDPDRHAAMLNRIPLKRFGHAEEMAGAIRYLVSPQASYITGQILLLDGGLTAY